MARYNIFDEEMAAYRNALAKINLNEEANPILHGELVSDPDTYNKVKQLLDCPDMEHAHKFLLDIDFDHLTDEIVAKVDNLFDLAVQRGYIKSQTANGMEDQTDEEPFDTEEYNEENGGYENAAQPDPADIEAKDPINAATNDLPSTAYTCLYSAMKNGDIKTGECYSNATSIERAKADAVNKLTRLGMTAIEIIAVEENNLDARGSDAAAYPTDGGTTFAPPVVTTPVPTTEGPDKQSAIDNAPDPATEEPQAEDEDFSEEPTEDEPVDEPEDTEEVADEPADEEPESEEETAEPEGDEKTTDEEEPESEEDEESEESEEDETDEEEESDDEEDEDEKLAEAYQKVLRGSLITEKQVLPNAIKRKIDSYAQDYEAEVREVINDPEEVKAILDATDSLAKDEKARTKLLDKFLEDDHTGFLNGFGDLFGIDPYMEDEVENAWWELVENQPRAALMYQLQGVGPEILDDVLNATGTKVSEAKKDEEEKDEEETEDDSSDEEETDDKEEKEDKKEEPKDEEPADDEEPAEEEPEEEEPKEELSKTDKVNLFKKYLGVYKKVLTKMKVSSYQDFDLAGRSDFYSQLSKLWSGNPSPTEFMTDANIKQIENMVIKVEK